MGPDPDISGMNLFAALFSDEPVPGVEAAIVMAHPGDEAVSASWLMVRLHERASVYCLTRASHGCPCGVIETRVPSTTRWRRWPIVTSLPSTLPGALGQLSQQRARGCVHTHFSSADVSIPGIALTASCGVAVFTQQRSTSATLQACATHPRGVNGSSASNISLIDPTHASSRWGRNPSRKRRALGAPSGCARIQASMNGPMSHAHTVP